MRRSDEHALMSTDQIVPLHPEAVEGDRRELRWVVPAGTLTFVGAVSAVPADVQSLLDDGTLEQLTLEPTAIRTRLGADRSWRIEGDRVRTVLQRAASDAQHWVPAGDASIDAVIRMAVQQVIAGEVGDYIRSHGGGVELLAVQDGAVEVRLNGACTHCPASEFTLTDRFEKAVREQCPRVGAITARMGEPARPGPRWLTLMPLRRRSEDR